jgi:glycosyltransferase involved in cell wall biosynthesis
MGIYAAESARTALPLLAGRSVALVHEWCEATGGSEQVFQRIATLIPHAELFTLWRDSDAEHVDAAITESWLARTPLRRHKALALPLMPLAWRTLSRRSFDVVISSSHAFAHTVRFGAERATQYLSYVHAPARYLWSPGVDARGRGAVRGAARLALRQAELRLSRHVHSYAANSAEVRSRIHRYWGRDATVIHPPVDVEFFANGSAADQAQDRRYLLGAGRWVPYKNFDLMIAIANEARVPLVIAGGGPEEVKLRRLAAKADVEITFEVRPSRERLRSLYWGAIALLSPAREDFGMVPVEAQACGTPIVGFAIGGLLDTVVQGETGYLERSPAASRFAAWVAKAPDLNRELTVRNAKRFSAENFDRRMSAWLELTVHRGLTDLTVHGRPEPHPMARRLPDSTF